MDVDLWLQGVTEMNSSFDGLISQKQEILGAMKTYVKHLFEEYMGIVPNVKIPLCQDNGKVQYGREIIVEIPNFTGDDIHTPPKFNTGLFEAIGWDFSMTKLPSKDYGWIIELTFYPFGDRDSED